MNRHASQCNNRLVIPVLAAVIATICIATVPIMARAALPAPAWLPGQPMLAGNQVIAMWMPVPGAVKYVIYLNGQKLMESPANQYIGPAPAESGKHKLEISAIDAAGTESPLSPPGYINIIAIEPPDKPFFRLDQNERTALIRWSRPAGAAIFNIYRSEESPDGPWKLLASLQEEAYHDVDLEYGKKYFYSVSAKDTSGKESGRSEPAEVMIAKPKKVQIAKKFPLTIVTSSVSSRVAFINEEPVTGISRIKRSPDGTHYIIFRDDRIMALDGNFNFLREMFIRKPDALRRDLQFWNLSFIDEDTALVCDYANMAVLTVNLANGNVLSHFTPRKPTMEEKPELLEELEKQFRTRIEILSALYIDEDNIWVADGVGSVMHIYNSDGEPVDWFIDFIQKDEDTAEVEKKRMSKIPDMMQLDDGSILAMSTRYAIRVDPESRELRYSIGRAGTMVGKFIGFGGWSIHDGRVLVSDPTMHTLQAFDLKNGDYLFSVGNKEKMADPAQPTRPTVDFNTPFYPFVLDNGGMIVYLPLEKVYVVLKLLEPMPSVSPLAESGGAEGG